MNNRFLKWRYIIGLIFLLALALRFLYFPNNIYFGFDQARDLFKVGNILKGDIQIVGPSTSIEGLYHGVLYYYLLAPVHIIFQGDPRVIAAFLRTVNAAGVFVIFFFTLILFSSKDKSSKQLAITAAVIASLLFAFSFEQTQFSIYMGNPSLASLSVTLIFFSLALVVFQKKWIGLPLGMLFYGASIQFEFALFYLIVPLAIVIGIFYKSFLSLPRRAYLLSVITFLFSVSSFIIAELKYGFRSLKTLTAVSSDTVDRSVGAVLSTYGHILSLMNKLNLFGELAFRDVGLAIIGILFFILLWKAKDIRKQLLLLGVWFFGLLLVYILGGGSADTDPLYYTNIGISPSLLIFTSFCIAMLAQKNRLAAMLVLVLILFANFQMITKYNPRGTITNINVQQGMLLGDQLKLIDVIYEDTKGASFAVKALTMPLFINTTWSYLFEWYGKSTYGNLPIWSGHNAIGYPGNLTVNDRQSELPDMRFTIIEPVRGIRQHDINSFYETENYFTSLTWEKEIGSFKLQKRTPL